MTCPVCLNHITRPRVTPCNHEFCSECLDTWLTRKLTCPLCRAFADDVDELYRKFRLRVEEQDFISTGPFWRQIEQDRAVLDELVIHVFDQGHHACKEFIIRNAQHLDVTNAELEGGTDGEQSHNWWPIYEIYQETFEALLQQFLDSAGCSAEEFLAAAKDASGIAEMYTKWFLSLSSYEMFVECMMDEEKRQRGMVDGS